VTLVVLLSAPNVIGVTNFRPIMKLEFAIAAIPFSVGIVKTWNSARIAGRSCAPLVELFSFANFADPPCVTNVPRPAPNAALYCVEGTPSLP
jgi:hypothetical protein